MQESLPGCLAALRPPFGDDRAMAYPMAWFITWTTYGTWLHGDARGSFLDRTYLRPNAELEAANRAQMTGEVVSLTDQQRAIVDAAIVNECLAQGWVLHARNVRSVGACGRAIQNGRRWRACRIACKQAPTRRHEGDIDKSLTQRPCGWPR